MTGHLGANPRITNLSLVSSAIEYSHTFGQHVKKLLIQSRSFKDLRMAFVAGETATNYVSLISGSPYWEDNVIGPITVYLKADGNDNNIIVEILEWQARD